MNALAVSDTAGAAAREEQAAAELDSLVALALRRAPALQARDADLLAAREEISVAGALPDPMVAFSATGEEYPGGGLGTEPMSVAALEFTQTIPWPGKRGRREAAAAARVPELIAGREEERRAVAADVRTAYADLYAIDGAVLALRRALALYDVLEPQALARYETGLGAQTDWLALRRARAALASDIDGELADRVEVVARLATALDDTAAAAAVRADALPAAAATPTSADGSAFAGIATAEAVLETARRVRESAQREGQPDLVVGAEYGWRDGLPPMLTARVGLELPLWRGRKQDAMARAAGYMEAGARAGERQARLQAGAEARALAARRDAASRAAGRLRGQILPLLDLTAESARARYLAGEAPATMLIDALRERAAARGELARAEAAHYAAGARLRALSGLDAVAGNGREP
jgi:outer membrane protein TolC